MFILCKAHVYVYILYIYRQIHNFNTYSQSWNLQIFQNFLPALLLGLRHNLTAVWSGHCERASLAQKIRLPKRVMIRLWG